MRYLLSAFICVILLSSILLAQGIPQPTVTISADREVYLTGNTIAVTIKIKNPNDTPIVIYDWPYLWAKTLKGREIEFLAKELLVRSDIRESKSDYITIKPKGEFSRTYQFIIKPVFEENKPQILTAKIAYNITRRQSDNYYYDFDKEGIQAKTKIPINAWYGTLTSKPIEIIVMRKSNEGALISKEDALIIAREICKNQGWAWKDVNIKDNNATWDISTNSKAIGMNAFIQLDKKTGNVVTKHLTGP